MTSLEVRSPAFGLTAGMMVLVSGVAGMWHAPRLASH